MSAIYRDAAVLGPPYWWTPTVLGPATWRLVRIRYVFSLHGIWSVLAELKTTFVDPAFFERFFGGRRPCWRIFISAGGCIYGGHLRSFRDRVSGVSSTTLWRVFVGAAGARGRETEERGGRPSKGGVFAQGRAGGPRGSAATGEHRFYPSRVGTLCFV